jgi:hypothetical protein
MMTFQCKAKRIMSYKYFVFLFCFTFYLVGCATRDSMLERDFQSNEAKFNALVRLSDSCLGEKKNRIVWADRPSLAEKPCADLMRSIGVEGLGGGGDASVQFYVRSLSSSHQKGYVFSEKPLTPLFDSLDAVVGKKDKAPPYQLVHKRIGDGWYLYYVNLNG